jgi:hypothetical protein
VTRALLLAAAVAAVGCSPDAPQSCPGQAVFDATFDGSLVRGPVAGDPWPALPRCPDALLHPERLAPFFGTLAADEGDAAALCRAGVVLFGTRSGAHWDVRASSGGAVLPACDLSCTATSAVAVVGDLVPDPDNPTTFEGALVEQLARREGSCDACALPCAARYVLTGTGGRP